MRRNEILILLHARILSFTCESGPFGDRRGSSALSDPPPWLRACRPTCYMAVLYAETETTTSEVTAKILITLDSSTLFVVKIEYHKERSRFRPFRIAEPA